MTWSSIATFRAVLAGATSLRTGLIQESTMFRNLSGTVLKRWARLAAMATVLALAYLGLYAWGDWLHDHLSRETVWKIRLGFVVALESAYVVLAVVVAAATPLTALLFKRARKRGASGVWAARVLLLCGSLLIALLAAEACVGLWWTRTHRGTAVPVGGLLAHFSENDLVDVQKPLEAIYLPTSFPDRPADAPRELLVLGESSAEGVPYSFCLSLGNLVAWQLEETHPGLRVHPRIMALSGDTLARQHEKLADLEHRPDVVIVYCGHNEFTARFPWSREVDHYLDEIGPSIGELTVGWLETHSPICRLAREEADKCRVAIPPPLGGYRTLVDVPAFTPQEYDLLLGDFEMRLESIVRFAEQVGAEPILISPPANDSAFEPNRSFLPPETSRSEREAFAREFLSIRAREEREPEHCLADYRKLLERYPGFAELHHRVGRLLERQGAWEEVYLHDRAARDLDGLPCRCPTPFQEVYRKVAKRHGCTFIDGQSYFHAIAPHGILDEHLFHDGMHPSLRGHIALSQAVMLALKARGAFGWPAERPVRPIDPLEVARHFRIGPQQWMKVCHWGVMFYQLTGGVRYDPSERRSKERAFGAAADRIKAGEAPERVGLANIGIPDPVPILPGAVSIPPPRLSQSSGP
jgi:hypothetical protein